MVCLNDFVIRAALNLQVTIGFNVAGVLVVAHLVSAKRVVAIKDGDFAGKRVDVSADLLLRGFHVNRRSSWRSRNRPCCRNGFSVGIKHSGGIRQIRYGRRGCCAVRGLADSMARQLRHGWCRVTCWVLRRGARRGRQLILR